MVINNNPGAVNYDYILQNQNRLTDSQEKLQTVDKKNDRELKEAVSNFTALFVKQMFAAMRRSVPESDFINAGFAEDVFTDMLDEKLSQQSSQQSLFNDLNRLIYQQLKE